MVETRSKRKPDSSSDLPKVPPKKVAKKEKPTPTVVSKKEDVAPSSVPKKEEKVKSAKTEAPSVGDTIDLEGFGGEVETHEGKSVTLKSLVDASKGGVVLFTYPKASTPGCTRQACMFRDKKDSLTTPSGLAIYGLSADTPKSNTAFVTKQSLNYELLCDPKRSLIGAIGLAEGPKTKRGVFVVDKTGKVLLAKVGSPEATVKWVEELVKA